MEVRVGGCMQVDTRVHFAMAELGAEDAQDDDGGCGC